MARDLFEAHEPSSRIEASRQTITLIRFFISRNLKANVTIFPQRGTILEKIAFLCCHENTKITPININSTLAVAARVPEVSRKPQQAYPALPDYDLSEHLPIL